MFFDLFKNGRWSNISIPENNSMLKGRNNKKVLEEKAWKGQTIHNLIDEETAMGRGCSGLNLSSQTCCVGKITFKVLCKCWVEVEPLGKMKLWGWGQHNGMSGFLWKGRETWASTLALCSKKVFTRCRKDVRSLPVTSQPLELWIKQTSFPQH